MARGEQLKARRDKEVQRQKELGKAQADFEAMDATSYVVDLQPEAAGLRPRTRNLGKR